MLAVLAVTAANAVHDHLHPIAAVLQMTEGNP